MTTANDKLIDAIVSLIRGTQEGRITWVVEKVTPKLVYETEYKARRLRIYEVPGHSPNLEIIDENGTPLWTFPRMSGLDDLLSSVRYQTADVKSFVDDIIRDDELERESGVH
jgi:hypothetical protein